MWVIASLVFACSLLVTYLVVGSLLGRRAAVAERLADYTDAYRDTSRRRWSGETAGERAVDRLNLSDSLERLLDRADLPMKPHEFALIVLGATLVMGGGGFLAWGVQGLPAAGVGFLTPLAWARLRQLRRQHAFVRQLPDALQSITNSLRAGYGFGQAMTVVASDLPPPISVEFNRAQREVNLGLTIEEALQNMARRMQSLDFDLAVSGILINRQVGGNLAELLDQVTATIRERVKLKNFIRVLTAQQRISALIILAVPPVLLIVLLAGMREYTNYLLVTRIGQVMLAVSVCMQLLGIYFIRRIVAIEV